MDVTAGNRFPAGRAPRLAAATGSVSCRAFKAPLHLSQTVAHPDRLGRD
jgi:hypothetical protein